MDEFLSRTVRKIFWKRYCDLEGKNNTYTFTSDFSILLDIIWKFELSTSAEGEEGFWTYYLNQSTWVNILLMTLQLAFHLLLAFLIYGFPLTYLGFPLDPIFSHFSILTIYMLPWFIFSLVCLIFLITVRYSPNYFTNNKVSMLKLWMGIGNSIFCARLISLGIRLHHYGVRTDCPAAAQLDNPADQTFTFFALLMMIDTTAVGIFSVFPFPYRFNLLHCLVEYISQLWRLYSCSGRISFRAEFKFVPLLLGFSLTFLYLMLSFYAAWLEHSARNSFKNAQRQRKAWEEKRELLHFLCFDLNKLLALFQNAFVGVATYIDESEEILSLKQSLEKQVQVAAAGVKEMVLMMRVEEDVRKQDSPLPLLSRSHVVLTELIAEVKRDLALGNSIDFSNALDRVSLQVDEVEVNVDLGGLEVLCRRFYSSATRKILLEEELTGSVSTTPQLNLNLVSNEGSRSLLSGTTTNAAISDSDYFLFGSLVLGPLKRFSAVDKKIKAELETCTLICLRVISSCGGLCWITSSSLNFLLACSVNELARIRTTPVEANISQNLYAIVDGLFEDELKRVFSLLCSEKSASSRVFRGSVEGAMERLSGSEIVFLDTVTKCRELRALGFEGRVVLVSGMHSLVGGMKDPAFDYSLPIPSLDGDINRLKTWLENPHTYSVSEPTEQSLERRIQTKFSFKRLSKKLGRIGWNILSFGMVPIESERQEAYLRWRLFTPVNSVWHHTKLADLCEMLFIIFEILSRVLGATSFEPNTIAFRAMNLVLLLFLARHWVFHLLWEPLNTPLVIFLRFSSALFLFRGRVFRILQLITADLTFLNVVTCQFSYSFLERMSLDELLNVRFGSLSFLQAMSSVLRLLGLGKTVLYPIPWPSTPAVSVLSSAALFLFLLALPRNILTYQMLACILLFQLVSFSAELLIEFNFELIHRQEFSSLCDYVLSDDLIHRCMCLSHPVVKHALEGMVDTKTKLLELLSQHLAKDKLLQVDTSILKPVESLRQCGLTIRELGNELTLHQLFLEHRSFMSSRDKFYLRTVFEDVLGLFRGNITVRGRLDSRLSVIRFDKEQFVTLLTCSLTVAQKRLKKSVSSGGIDQDMNNDIFVDIKLLEREGVIHRFADLRSMIVVVVDTSTIGKDELNTDTKNMSDRKLEELEIGDITGSFSERVCERFATGLEDHALYETGTLEHDRYTHFTRFSFPYQLTLDSHVASEAVRDGEDTEVYVGEIKTDALLTKLQKMESLARCLKLKRRQGRLKSLTMKTWRELKEQGICCTMLIVSTIRQDQYLEPLVDALQQYGWVCLFTYPYSGDQTIKLSDEQQSEVDCIMLDRCAEYEDNMNFNDLIIGVRAQGYRNLIIDLTPSLSEIPQAESQQQQFLEGVDLQVTTPLSMESGVRIFKEYENKLRKLLFG